MDVQDGKHEVIAVMEAVAVDAHVADPRRARRFPRDPGHGRCRTFRDDRPPGDLGIAFAPVQVGK
jgi:hypothetical protein